MLERGELVEFGSAPADSNSIRRSALPKLAAIASGVTPPALRALALALLVMSNSANEKSPREMAMCKGVPERPDLFLIESHKRFGSAPCASRNSLVDLKPLATDKCKGVAPCLFLAFTSAPRVTSRSTV